MMPQKPEEPVGRELGLGYKYLSLGLSFAAGILFFVGAGYLLDRWIGSQPIFTILGTLLGSGLSFFWVLRRLAADEAAEKAEHDRLKR
jgi:F0F1-type ATP synthase assembly protein I